MVDPLSIITTTDGSHTIKNELTGDTYHSIHGAIQESNHVFIHSGLNYFLQSNHKEVIRILEVGFGTGLNALLTLNAGENVAIEYTTLEPNPLSPEIYEALNFENREMFLCIHQAPWEKPQHIVSRFTLVKHQANLQQASFPENYFDLVYYDAFAPTSQPELWTLEIFQRIRSVMTSPSVFVTYCAKGQVKRDLKTAGFTVESIPGPPGKREMIRAKVT
jgi:tRNA U34 5-methylaminomethyl-2-thiouridine-forming methyltransferase MnmC